MLYVYLFINKSLKVLQQRKLILYGRKMRLVSIITAPMESVLDEARWVGYTHQQTSSTYLVVN